MKYLWVFVFIPLLSWGQILKNANPYSLDLYARRGELKAPQELTTPQEMERVLFSETQIQHRELQNVKYWLINGEVGKAQARLIKLAYANSKLRPIIYRYLAILYFIEGSFEKAWDILDRPELSTFPQYGRICLLKVLTEIVLSKTHLIGKDWERCRVENPKSMQASQLPWIEMLIEMKTNPYPGLTKTPFENKKLASFTVPELKIFLKLAMYLNQEALVAPEIPYMEFEQLQDPEVRELAGHILFRTGAFAKSYKFISDLTTPNAENMKGNLYVLRQKYELAYSQFKLALEQKQNSQNAMERLLPLAWILGDWDNGAKYAERVMASPQTQVNKLTLLAAFQLQKGDFEETIKTLDAVSERSRRGTHVDATQLYSFAGLMLNKPDLAAKNASLSCGQYDLVNCWILFQLTQWESFPVTIRREGPLTVKKSWEALTQEEVTRPLIETVYVNQLDIEELDDQFIQLIPKSTP